MFKRILFGCVCMSILLAIFMTIYHDINIHNNSQYSFDNLYSEVNRNNTKEVKRLLERGIDPWPVNDFGRHQFKYGKFECLLGRKSRWGYNCHRRGMIYYQYSPDILIQSAVNNGNIELTQIFLNNPKIPDNSIKFYWPFIPDTSFWSHRKVNIFSIYEALVSEGDTSKINVIMNDDRIKVDKYFVSKALCDTQSLNTILKHKKANLSDTELTELMVEIPNKRCYYVADVKSRMKAIIQYIGKIDMSVLNSLFERNNINWEYLNVVIQSVKDSKEEMSTLFVNALNAKSDYLQHSWYSEHEYNDFNNYFGKVIEDIDPSYNDYEPFVLAAQHGFYDIVESFMNRTTIDVTVRDNAAFIHDKHIGEDNLLKTLKILLKKNETSLIDKYFSKSILEYKPKHELFVQMAEKGYLKVVKFLVEENGVNKNYRSKLALFKARHNGHMAVSDYLN